MNRKSWAVIDALVILISPILAAIISLAFKTNVIISSFLFYGLIAVYLSWRTPTGIKRATIFAIPLAFLSYISLDYIITRNGAWFVPTIFPFRFYGTLALEDFIWGCFASYSFLIFYEHFLDKGNHRQVGKNLKYLLGFLVVVLMGVLFLHFQKPEFLRVPYAYLTIVSVFGMVPMATILLFYPRLLSKIIIVAIYFFFVNLLHELVALRLGQWYFTGSEFVGWVELFGQKFPFEEFFFFIMLSPVALLSYFEFFDDDRHLIR